MLAKIERDPYKLNNINKMSKIIFVIERLLKNHLFFPY